MNFVQLFARTRLALGKHRRKLIGGGIFAGVGSLIVVGFFALLPLKLEATISRLIAGSFGGVEDIVERRVDKYMESYVNKYVFKRFRDGGSPVIATGNFAADVLNNWKVGKFEDRLEQKHGIKFDYDKDKGRLIIKTPSGDLDGGAGDFKFSKLDNREGRAFFRKAVRDETRWYQVYKRRHTRNLLMQKYKVKNWRMFEDTRNKVDDKIFAAKKKLKLELIDHVVRPVSQKYATYFACIVEGCDLKTLDPDIPGQGRIGGDGTGTDSGGFDANGDGELSEEEAKNKADFEAEQAKVLEGSADNAAETAVDAIDNEIAEGAADASTKLAGKEVTEKLQKLMTDQIIKKVGLGIGLLELLVAIDEAVEHDTIGRIIEDKNKLQYANVFADYAKLASQFKAGELDGPEVSAMMEQLDGIEQSKIMQQDFKVSAFLGTRTAHAATECDGKPVPAGELICPDKKVKNENLAEIYENPTFDMVHVLATGWKALGAPVRWGLRLISNVVGDFVGWIINHIPGASNMQEWMASGINKVMGFFFGPVLSGNETGGDLYDAIAGGADVTANSVAQFSTGGRKLSNEEAMALRQSAKESAEELALADNSWDRFFSTENPYSLISQLALALPSGKSSAANYALAALSLPSRIGQYVLAVLTPQSMAVPARISPHGVDQYGWPLNDPATKAFLERDPIDNPYTQEECDEIEAKWEQDRAAHDGDSTMLNPCRAELLASESMSAMFTDEDDGGLGLAGDGSGEEEGNIDLANGTTQDLAHKILDIKDGKIIYESEGVRNTIVMASQGQKIPAGDGSFTVLRADLLRLILAIHDAGITIRISSLTGGEHAENSLHYFGKAMDIGNEEVAPELMKFVYKHREKLNIDELIFKYPPDGTSNLDLGQPHTYSAGTLDAHANHIHIGVL